MSRTFLFAALLAFCVVRVRSQSVCECDAATFPSCIFAGGAPGDCTTGVCSGFVCQDGGQYSCVTGYVKGVVESGNTCVESYVQSVRPQWSSPGVQTSCQTWNCKAQLGTIVATPNPDAAKAGYSSAIFSLYVTQDNYIIGSFDYNIEVFSSGCPAGQTFTVAHIHTGAAGVNGPPVWTIFGGTNVPNLTTTPFGPGGTYVFNYEGADGTLDAAIAALLANPAGYYINLHTTCAPGGLIRGQVFYA